MKTWISRSQAWCGGGRWVRISSEARSHLGAAWSWRTMLGGCPCFWQISVGLKWGFCSQCQDSCPVFSWLDLGWRLFEEGASQGKWGSLARRVEPFCWAWFKEASRWIWSPSRGLCRWSSSLRGIQRNQWIFPRWWDWAVLTSQFGLFEDPKVKRAYNSWELSFFFKDFFNLVWRKSTKNFHWVRWKIFRYNSWYNSHWVGSKVSKNNSFWNETSSLDILLELWVFHFSDS